MKQTIDQFMWGYQPHFRGRVRYEIQDILSEIGLQTNERVEVLLVGFATESSLPHQVCIEPEDSPLGVADLGSIGSRTAEIVKTDPESQIFYSDYRSQMRIHHRLFLRSRGKALGEAIENTGHFEGLSFFVSDSAPIGGYEVHTCVGIPKDGVQSVPKFNNPIKDDYHGRHIAESFLQQIIGTCLGRADQALYLPEPGSGFSVLGDKTDIIRTSADHFARGLSLALTNQPRDLFRLANGFCSLTYERAGATGQLVVTKTENLVNKLKVTFQSPIGLGQSRSVRKMLELTNEENALLTNGGLAYGLGSCIPAPDVARIVVESHCKWSLSVDNTTLMKVTNEHATLPKQILDKNFFY